MMEIFRLNLAEQLSSIIDVLDMDHYITEQIESIIVDQMGIESDSESYFEFHALLDGIYNNPDCKEHQIYMNTWKGIQHFQLYENEVEAQKIMNINFDDHCTIYGKPNPIDSDMFIQIMSKIYD